MINHTVGINGLICFVTLLTTYQSHQISPHKSRLNKQVVVFESHRSYLIEFITASLPGSRQLTVNKLTGDNWF